MYMQEASKLMAEYQQALDRRVAEEHERRQQMHSLSLGAKRSRTQTDFLALGEAGAAGAAVSGAELRRSGPRPWCSPWQSSSAHASTGKASRGSGRCPPRAPSRSTAAVLLWRHAAVLWRTGVLCVDWLLALCPQTSSLANSSMGV